jgi:hypothetical protein
MKKLFKILILCVFAGCTVEREVQIREYRLTLQRIDTIQRAFTYNELKLTWWDEEHVPYKQFIPFHDGHSFKVGDSKILFLRY